MGWVRVREGWGLGDCDAIFAAMDDRSAEVYREALRAMTAERKLEVAHGLRELAWELQASGIRRSYPGLSEAEVQERVREAFFRALR